MLLNRKFKSHIAAHFLKSFPAFSSPINWTKLYSISISDNPLEQEKETIDEATTFLQNDTKNYIQPRQNVTGLKQNQKRQIQPQQRRNEPSFYASNQNRKMQIPTRRNEPAFYPSQQNRRNETAFYPSQQNRRNEPAFYPSQQSQMKQIPTPAFYASNQNKMMQIQPQQNDQPKQQMDTLVGQALTQISQQQNQIGGALSNLAMTQQQISSLYNCIMQMQNSMIQQQSTPQIGGFGQMFPQPTTQQQISAVYNYIMQMQNSNAMNHPHQQQTNPFGGFGQMIPTPQQQQSLQNSNNNQPIVSMISKFLNQQAQQKQQKMPSEGNREQPSWRENIQSGRNNDQLKAPKFTSLPLDQGDQLQQNRRNLGEYQRPKETIKPEEKAKTNKVIYLDELQDFEEVKRFEKPKIQRQEEPSKEEEEEAEKATDSESKKESEESLGNSFLSGKMEASSQ